MPACASATAARRSAVSSRITICTDAVSGHRDDRPDDAEERRADDDARDHEEPRDVRGPPLDRRLQHVVLDLLVDDADDQHDQRLRDALGERDEREHDRGERRADLRDQAEQPRDDPEREREGDAEQPGGGALHGAGDPRDHDRAERVAPDRPRDALLEDGEPRSTRVGKRTLWSERERFGRSITRKSVMKTIVIAPRPNPKIRPPTSNASPSLLGRSDASDSARSWSFSPMSVRAVELLEELGGPDALDDRREVLDQVAHRADERAHEQVGEAEEARRRGRGRRSSRRSRASCAHRSSSQVTGVWRTIARKSAMNTQRTACRAATNAHTNAMTPRIVTIVRGGDRDLDALRRRLGSRHGGESRTRAGGRPQASCAASGARGERARRCARPRSRCARAARPCSPSPAGASPTSSSELTSPLTDWTSIQSAEARAHRDGDVAGDGVRAHAAVGELELDVARDGADRRGPAGSAELQVARDGRRGGCAADGLHVDVARGRLDDERRRRPRRR